VTDKGIRTIFNKQEVKENRKQGPVFIVGLPRSGTTVVSVFLNKNYNIHIPEETHLFTRDSLGLFNSFFRGIPSIQVNTLLGSEFGTRLGLPKRLNENFNLEIEMFPTLRQWANCLDHLFSVLAKNRGRQFWGEKTPGHMEFVALLAQMFPLAQFLCVTRNPLDTIASLKEVPWVSHSARVSAVRWHFYQKLSEKYARTLGSRWHQLSYEEFVVDPVKSVFDSGLNLEKSVLLNTEETINFGDDEPWKSLAAAPLTPEKIGSWRDRLTGDEKEAIGQLFPGWFPNGKIEAKGMNWKNLSSPEIWEYLSMKHRHFRVERRKRRLAQCS